MSKRLRIIALFLIGLLFLPVGVFAHPGRTDANGCHVCRTNCKHRGLSYGEYHCHSKKPEKNIKKAKTTARTKARKTAKTKSK